MSVTCWNLQSVDTLTQSRHLLSIFMVSIALSGDVSLILFIFLLYLKICICYTLKNVYLLYLKKMVSHMYHCTHLYISVNLCTLHWIACVHACVCVCVCVCVCMCVQFWLFSIPNFIPYQSPLRSSCSCIC